MGVPSEAEVRRSIMLKQQIDALTAQRKELHESWDLTELDTHPVGEWKVAVQRNATFNAEKAKADLTPEEYELTLDVVSTSATAKKNLPPARYLLCQREGAPKIVISRLEDD